MNPEERARKIAQAQERIRRDGRLQRGEKGWPGTVPPGQRVRPFLIDGSSEPEPTKKPESSEST